LTKLSKYLLIMELRSDAMLYSTWVTKNLDAGHIKCSCGLYSVCGLQVPHP